MSCFVVAVGLDFHPAPRLRDCVSVMFAARAVSDHFSLLRHFPGWNVSEIVSTNSLDVLSFT